MCLLTLFLEIKTSWNQLSNFLILPCCLKNNSAAIRPVPKCSSTEGVRCVPPMGYLTYDSQVTLHVYCSPQPRRFRPRRWTQSIALNILYKEGILHWPSKWSGSVFTPVSMVVVTLCKLPLQPGKWLCKTSTNHRQWVHMGSNDPPGCPLTRPPPWDLQFPLQPKLQLISLSCDFFMS